jgi:hypothetical protein
LKLQKNRRRKDQDVELVIGGKCYMNANDRKLRVFLCHASQDKPVVRELYQRLNAEGWIDPWLDEEKLLPGQNWDLEIEKAVEAADAVIVFLSNNSVTKEGYIQKELRKIIHVAEEKPDGTIFIIPVRLSDCPLPQRFNTWQYENYFPQEKAIVAYKRIRKSLSLRAKSLGIDLSNYSIISSEEENSLLLQDAIFLARTNETISISLLQRRLRIGYAKSERLIIQMEELGLVEKPNEASSSWNHVVKFVGK